MSCLAMMNVPWETCSAGREREKGEEGEGKSLPLGGGGKEQADSSSQPDLTGVLLWCVGGGRRVC